MKAEAQPTNGATRESGLATANGCCLRRFVSWLRWRLGLNFRCMAVDCCKDVEGTAYWYSVRQWDKKGNSMQIARGKVDSLEKLPRYKRKIIDVVKPANEKS